MCKINNYELDLKYADSDNIVKKANALIREKLSFMGPIIRIDSISDRQMQYAGIDKLILFSNGKTIRVEEKIRRNDYGDILIELIANNKFATYEHKENNYQFTHLRGVGWGMKQYSSDLLFYFIESENKGFLFSWKKFQAIFKAFLPYWYEFALNKEFGFSLKTAKNKDYDSINLVVPKHIFFEEYEKIGGKIL